MLYIYIIIIITYISCLINIVHIIMYNIGDGDSNIIKRLPLAKPYGPDIVIKKIECFNHILRNYINKLHELSKKKKAVKAKVYRVVCATY